MEFFGPRMRPKTFFNCFVLKTHSSKAKQLRNVLGCILGLNISIQNLSFSEESQKQISFLKQCQLKIRRQVA